MIAPASKPASVADPLDTPAVVRPTLDRQAYQAVREALMAGRLRPGQAITLRSLAETLGVSRQPVQIALTRLEAEGALVAAPASGTLFVPTLTPGELEELLDIRRHLEGLATCKAAARVVPEELVGIRDCCGELEAAAEAADAKGYALANWAFHAAVYRASHSPMLCAAIEPFWLRIGPYVEQMMPGRAELVASIPRHWEVVEALARHDGDAAADAIRRDLTESAKGLAILLQEMPRQPSSRIRSVPGIG